MSYNCTGISNTCNSLISYCKKNYYIDQCTCIKNKDFYDMYCIDTTNIIGLFILIIGGLFFLTCICLCYTKFFIILYKRNIQQNIQRNQIQNHNNTPNTNTMIEIQPNYYLHNNSSNTDLPKYEDISSYPNSNDSPPAYDNRSNA